VVVWGANIYFSLYIFIPDFFSPKISYSFPLNSCLCKSWLIFCAVWFIHVISTGF